MAGYWGALVMVEPTNASAQRNKAQQVEAGAILRAGAKLAQGRVPAVYFQHYFAQLAEHEHVDFLYVEVYSTESMPEAAAA